MPIFEYKCKCGKIFETLTLSAKESEQLKCPECEGLELTKLISKPYLPNSVGAPADLHGSSACCGSKPENQSCTPNSCCGDTAGKGLDTKILKARPLWSGPFTFKQRQEIIIVLDWHSRG